MCHHGPLTHLTAVRLVALVSKLHQLGQNQSTSSSALDIACSLIFCVRRERWFNRERGRQDFCPFAPFSKYSLNRAVLQRVEFCSSFTQSSLGEEKCCCMTLHLAVVCVLFPLCPESAQQKSQELLPGSSLLPFLVLFSLQASERGRETPAQLQREL